MSVVIRFAKPLEDAPRILALYAPYIERTAITFESRVPDFPEKLSRALMSGGSVTWYVDFDRDGIKYIVLRGHVLTYPIGDAQAKKRVMETCLTLGIPAHQLDWEETL